MRFVWGMGTEVSRSPEGKAMSASLDERYQGGALLTPSAIMQITSMCRLLETAPPERVHSGSLRCPLRDFEKESAAAGAQWPASSLDTLMRLRSVAGRDRDLVGFDSSGQVSWLAVTVSMGGSDSPRTQSAWFEKAFQWSEELPGATLHGWYTEPSFAWMEAMDEALFGTASVLLNTAMFTGATLFFLTGSARVAASTLFGVFAVLFCFMGWLGLRGFPFGAIEGIGIGIFIGFSCDYCVHVSQAYFVDLRGDRKLFKEKKEGMKEYFYNVAIVSSDENPHPLKSVAETVFHHAGPSLYGAALTT